MTDTSKNIVGEYHFFNPEKCANNFDGAVPKTFEELQNLQEQHGVLSTIIVTDNPEAISLMVHNEFDGEVEYFGPFGEIHAHRGDYPTLEAAQKDGADYVIASHAELDSPSVIAVIKESAEKTAFMYGHEDRNAPTLYIVANGKNLGPI